MARVVPAVVVVALVPACGGDGDATGTATAGASTAASGLTVERIDAAAAAIDGEWGERDGFAVVMLAVDRGYGVDQIVEHPSIEGDGAIDGVEPSGPALGLIERAGSAARWEGRRASGSVLVAYQGADGPADTYVVLLTGKSLGDLFDAAKERRDRRAREAAEAEAFEAKVSAIAAGLLARGYSVEDVIEAIALSTWAPASLNAPCFYVPGAAPSGSDQLSSDCPPLATSGAEGGASGSGAPSLTDSAPAGPIDGVYVNDEWPAPAGGPVIEVLETDIAVTVIDGSVDGGIVWVVVVRSVDGDRTTIQHATQAIEFEGTVSADGTFEGAGRTRTSYELISCEPEERCSGVTATTSPPDGVAVTLTGTVRDGTFEAEIVNSVSGAPRTFEAHRE